MHRQAQIFHGQMSDTRFTLRAGEKWMGMKKPALRAGSVLPGLLVQQLADGLFFAVEVYIVGVRLLCNA